MTATFANESKQLLLDQRLANPPYDNLQYGLLTDAGNPLPEETLDDLTEVSGSGYARQTVSGWSAALLLGDGHAYSEADPVTFTSTEPTDPWTTARRWFLWDVANSKLVAQGTLPTEFALAAGASRSITPLALLTHE